MSPKHPLIRSLTLALCAVFVCASLASAAPAHKKRKHVHRKDDYGFLPGYAELRAERERDEKWGTSRWWYGGPGFYRGRWNGGGFGPCRTQTPIGPVWNCGR